MSGMFKWLKPINQIINEKTGGDDGLLVLANEAERLMDPYVPADNLLLAQNVRTYVQKDEGIIHYTSPYAHYMWEGTLYVDPKYKIGAFTDGNPELPRFWSRPNVNKVSSTRKLSYSKFRHPKATSHWNDAMVVARGNELLEAYQNYVNRGAR